MNIDTAALQERIARALHEHWVAEPAGGSATEAWTNCTCGIRISVPGGTRDEAWRRGEAHQAEEVAAAVLPVIRKAQADALRHAALEDSANLITIAGWEVEAVEAMDLRARADALEARR